MSEKCKMCGYEIHPSYKGVCITCSAPYEAGRADMARDMFEAFKDNCEGDDYFDGANFAECKDKCTFETCPIVAKVVK